MGRPRTDLTGQTFGRLYVIRPTRAYQGKESLSLCRCECLNEVVVSNNNLRRGLTQSCGCLVKDIVTNDLTGMKFGHLTVIERAGTDKKSHHALWKCECDCGGEKIVPSHGLKTGNVKTCGCRMR
jgi:hypothetical protein